MAGLRMHTRPIPATGEPLPVVGVGTWQGFDVAGNADETARLSAVVDALFAAGGSVIDSSPMYGRAEAMVGNVLAQGRASARSRLPSPGAARHPSPATRAASRVALDGARASGSQARPLAPAQRGEGSSEVFLATKVWTRGREAGIAQMRESLRRLRVDRVDLMQVHNLLDTDVHWPVLEEGKAQGRVRYLGLTHYTITAYAELEAAMRRFRPDFVQVDYSVDARVSGERILPLAADLGIAVLVNRPFGGGGLLGALRGQPLPDIAAELACGSWAQLLLKYVLGHPAVTCVIPGTANPANMAGNAAAGAGVIANEAQRARIVAAYETAVR
jgi:diketogulonate reductase-like aldo/keto reductase